MRAFFAILLAGLASTVLGQGPGGKVEVKGPHICCAQCVKVVGTILAKVDGVSEVKADAKTRSVAFSAKDAKAADAGVKALIDGGFFGSATLAGKAMKLDVAAPEKGAKANVVVVKDVHVCCGQCQKAINVLFKDSKVSYEGKGAQRTVRVEGTNLDSGVVLEALRKAGFNGAPQK